MHKSEVFTFAGNKWILLAQQYFQQMKNIE